MEPNESNSNCSLVPAKIFSLFALLFFCISNPAAALPNCSSQIYDVESDGYGWENGESCVVTGNSEVTVFPAPVGASQPVCIFQLSDADNDGYGWENSTSCIVTADSVPPPLFVNEQTGMPVDLQRVYWDGNTDFANKTIQCDLYYFNEVDRIYKVLEEYYQHYEDRGWPEATHPSTQFYHRPIPSTAPHEGWITDFKTSENENAREFSNGTPQWTVEDGLYFGPTMLQAPYVEFVQLANGIKAIRRWVRKDGGTALRLRYSGERIRDNGYYECRDLSGADFRPTGRIGTPTTTPFVKSDIVLTANDQEQAPNEIVNLKTGMPVTLEKAYWNYNEDVAGKFIYCTDYTWFADNNQYIASVGRGTEELFFAYHYPDTDNAIHYYRSFDGSIQALEQVEIENGTLMDSAGFMFASQYVEKIDDDRVQFWTKSEYYTLCDGVPTGTAPQSSDVGTTDETSTGSESTDNGIVGNLVGQNNDVDETAANQGIQGENSVPTVSGTNSSGGGSLLSIFLFILVWFRPIGRSALRVVT